MDANAKVLNVLLRENMPLIKQQLRRLREDIEAEQGELTPDQAFLLIDVCQALGMAESETIHVLGEKYVQWLNRAVTITFQIPQALVEEAKPMPLAGV